MPYLRRHVYVFRHTLRCAVYLRARDDAYADAARAAIRRFFFFRYASVTPCHDCRMNTG